MSEDKAIYQTTLDMDAIEALANAATPGPWEGEYLIYRKKIDSNDDDCFIAEIARDGDGPFIAATRSAVPALVAEVRRLRAALAVFADRDNWREVPEWGPNGLGGYNYIVHVWQKSDFSPPWVKAWEILGSELTKKGGQE